MPRDRPDPAAGPVPRGARSAAGIRSEYRLRALRDRHRQPDPARHRLRDGRQPRTARSATTAKRSIAYFGDGASSQGDVNESFNFASVFQAPVVFFCQNNGWAISEPSERQSRVPICERSAGFGFPGIRVDGNDVLACYAVTRQRSRPPVPVRGRR